MVCIVLCLFCESDLDAAGLQSGRSSSLLRSWSELLDRYEQFRDDNYPLIPSFGSVQEYGTWEHVLSEIGIFSCDRWFWYFSDGTVRLNWKLFEKAGIKEKTPFIVYEDIYTADVVLAVEVGGQSFRELCSRPVEPYLSALERGEDVWEETSRRRIVLHGFFVSPEYVEITVNNTAAELTTSAVPSLRSALLAGSAEITNLCFSGMNGYSNRIEFEIAYANGFTNQLGIFSCTNLVAPEWVSVGTAVVSLVTNRISWVWSLENDAADMRFFRCANMDVDTDGDGLPDAAERLLYGTSPYSYDMDNDGFPDSYEIAHGTDPFMAGDYPSPTVYVATNQSIQAAVSNAVDYDIICLLPGTFKGTGNHDVDLLGKKLILTSSSGAEHTEIDCEQARLLFPSGNQRGLIITNGETHATIIREISINNGLHENGGAVYCKNASARFECCSFRGNKATNDAGGAVYCEGSGGGILS